MARTLKLTVAYDGTGLVGWQRQSAGISVQGLLEAALERIEGRPVAVVGAGRTDAGVHALGQVASLRLEHAIPAQDLVRALNAMLPPEVRVIGAEQAPDGFHARYAAVSKTYRYAILTGGSASPFLHRYAWHTGSTLAVRAMSDAARLVEGAHDFATFQSAGSSAKTTNRTVFSSTIVRSPSGGAWPGGWIGAVEDPSASLVTYEITGDGFLRHMVRAIVGSLVEVGMGRREPAWMGELLTAGSRAAAGPTAPACGLWLVAVTY